MAQEYLSLRYFVWMCLAAEVLQVQGRRMINTTRGCGWTKAEYGVTLVQHSKAAHRQAQEYLLYIWRTPLALSLLLSCFLVLPPSNLITESHTGSYLGHLHKSKAQNITLSNQTSIWPIIKRISICVGVQKDEVTFRRCLSGLLLSVWYSLYVSPALP